MGILLGMMANFGQGEANEQIEDRRKTICQINIQLLITVKTLFVARRGQHMARLSAVATNAANYSVKRTFTICLAPPNFKLSMTALFILSSANHTADVLLAKASRRLPQPPSQNALSRQLMRHRLPLLLLHLRHLLNAADDAHAVPVDVHGGAYSKWQVADHEVM